MPVCRNHPDVSEGVRHCSRCGGTFCRDCLVMINNAPYCATCKNERLLDVRSGVDRTTLTLAGIGKRFAAVFLDNLILAIPMYFVMFTFIFSAAATNKQPNPLFNLIGIPLSFAFVIYEALMMSYKNGRTLGKMALKVRVVRVDGTPISTGQAWGRAAMKMVLGCLFIVDYLPAFFTNDRTTLHDMAASTRVIDEY